MLRRWERVVKNTPSFNYNEKNSRGATEATSILIPSSEGRAYIGQEPQPPRETHNWNLSAASEEGEVHSFPWKSSLCTAPKINFHSLGSNIFYFKGPGSIDSVETGWSLGFRWLFSESSWAARRTNTAQPRQPSLATFLFQVKRIPGPFPPFLALTLPCHCPFTSTKPYKTTSLGDLVHRWQEQTSRLL